jgi:glycosyltransferase involved in cell wall biosynthesis
MYQQNGRDYSEVRKRDKYTFTVFTPTYNRAHTLKCVFDSLRKQTFQDFEWLIVDDGSTDNTMDLIDEWKRVADFDIYYIYKDNGGKHTAINRGVEEAQGELFLILDSDDSCIPETLERFNYHWQSILIDHRHEFSGVTVLCMDEEGRLVGDKFPKDICDMSPLQMRSLHGVSGEKWGFHKTDVFREFPFPEIPGEKFIAEGLIWNRIALKYKVRHVNEMLRIYKYSSDGLSASLLKTRIRNPISTALYYKELIHHPIPFKLKIKSLINYIRFSFHVDMSVIKIIQESRYIGFTILIMPIAYFFYIFDIRKINKI